MPPLETAGGSADRVTAAAIRESNRAAVYAHLRDVGPSARSELKAATGLARPTIDAVVRELVRESLVIESRRPAGSAGGRPATLLGIRPDARLLATVRLTSAGLETTLADLEGSPRTRALSPRPDLDAGRHVIAEGIAAAVGRAAAELTETGPLGAVCLCLPGWVDRNDGSWLLPWATHGSRMVIAPEVERLLGAPTTVANVAAAALVGAFEDDPDRASSATLVYLGQGVGSASTSRGRLIDGSTGTAGEIGHASVPGLDTTCHCGRRGCVETVTSAVYLKRSVGDLTASTAPSTMAEMEALSDPRVDRLLDDAADTLATATSWIVDIVNPSVVYLGGSGFLDGSIRFRNRFAETLLATTYAPNGQGLRIAAAPVDSAVRGSHRLAAELLPGVLRPLSAVGFSM